MNKTKQHVVSIRQSFYSDNYSSHKEVDRKIAKAIENEVEKGYHLDNISSTSAIEYNDNVEYNKIWYITILVFSKLSTPKKL